MILSLIELARFYFPGFLVGPYIDYASYKSLIDESIYNKVSTPPGTPGINGNGTKAGRKVPSGRKRVAYRKMAIGLGFLGLFVSMGGTYNYSVTLQTWFASHSIFYRFVHFETRLKLD